MTASIKLFASEVAFKVGISLNNKSFLLKHSLAIIYVTFCQLERKRG